MSPSSILLFSSLGAIFVLLMIYIYIFTFERKSFLILWFIGWLVIGLNYGLDAFSPGLFKERSVLILSLVTYFYANLAVASGTLIFLRLKERIAMLVGFGILWSLPFLFIVYKSWPDLLLIQYTTLSVYAMSFGIGIAMIKASPQYGRLALFLGLLNIIWVVNTIVSSFILETPNMAPYVISQIILLLNAIGLVQLFFRGQKRDIEQGITKITYLTLHDKLTGLYNKAYCNDKIVELDKDSSCLPISLILGDMNGLKFVNDVFGHQEGDNWLRSVAQILRQECRPGDIVARYGGDEFAVILPNTDSETAQDIAKRISAVCQCNKQTEMLLSISLGVSTKTDMTMSLTSIIKEAEETMYSNKLVEGKKARLAMARSISKLLHTKGYEPKEHIERTEALCRVFGRKINMSMESLNNLVQAIHLHDIGKIGIPGSIILKGSQLNEEEWLIVRKHVEIGYRIARVSEEFAHLADTILYHHEWWNGQGYVQGLKGEDIPYLSRIISIIDAFDIMTHEQPYKPAISISEALEELSRMAGIQFDPTLTASFIEMIKEQSQVAEGRSLLFEEIT